MAQKTIISEVSCINSLATSYPSLFGLVLEDDLKARIRTLAETARTLGVHAIEEFCLEGVWADIECAIVAEHDIEDLSGEFAMSLLRGLQEPVDAPMLRVSPHEFYLVATPGLCDDFDQGLFTKRIPLSELDSDDTLYLVQE